MTSSALNEGEHEPVHSFIFSKVRPRWTQSHDKNTYSMNGFYVFSSA